MILSIQDLKLSRAVVLEPVSAGLWGSEEEAGGPLGNGSVLFLDLGGRDLS